MRVRYQHTPKTRWSNHQASLTPLSRAIGGSSKDRSYSLSRPQESNPRPAVGPAVTERGALGSATPPKGCSRIASRLYAEGWRVGPVSTGGLGRRFGTRPAI